MAAPSDVERSVFDQLVSFIKEELKQRALARKDLAKLMDMSPAYVTQSLSNDDKRYNIRPLLRMIEALSMDVHVSLSPKNRDQEVEELKEKVQTLSFDLTDIAKRLHLLAR